MGEEPFPQGYRMFYGKQKQRLAQSARITVLYLWRFSCPEHNIPPVPPMKTNKSVTADKRVFPALSDLSRALMRWKRQMIPM